VFFNVNTLTMQAFWSALPPGLVTVLDVNGTINPASPFAPLQAGFQTTLAALLASGGQQAVVRTTTSRSHRSARWRPAASSVSSKSGGQT